MASALPPWVLTGRQGELDQLASALLGVRRPSVALVGPEGAGRTRLLRELLDRARAAGWDVEASTATTSSAMLPLGCLSALVPAGAPADAGASFRAALDALEQRSSRRPLLVAVDDAHLLDETSAALLLTLVERSLASVAVTLLAGASATDAVLALTRLEGQAYVQHLGPLSDAAVDELVAASLGEVDGLTAVRLRTHSEGRPLWLRALLRAGLDAGTLSRRAGVWTWDGQLDAAPAAGGPHSAVGRALGALDAEVRRAAELVAVAGTVTEAELRQAAGDAVTEAVLRHGLVVDDADDRRGVLRIAHPLYAELLRARLPEPVRRRLLGELAVVRGAAPLRRRGDLVRLADVAVAARRELDAGILLAAGRAVRSTDRARCERFARAALGAHPDAEQDLAARALLADVLEKTGRHAEALGLMSACPAGGSAHWEVTLATNAYWSGARSSREVASRLASFDLAAPGGDEVAATTAWVLVFSGDCGAGLDIAAALLLDARSGDRTIVWAATAAATALAALGQPLDALPALDRGRLAADRLGDALPFGHDQLGWVQVLVELVAGRPGRAVTLAEQGRAAALLGGSDIRVGTWAAFAGLAARHGGLLDTARRRLREALALLGATAPYGADLLLHSQLVAVEVQRGDLGAAQAALPGDAPAELNALFASFFDADRAWLDAAVGVRSAVLDRLAATTARAAGTPGLALLAAAELVRLGGAAAASPLLDALDVQGEGLPRWRSAARALASRDVPQLEALAGAFEQAGAPLPAVELYAVAAEHAEARGDRPAARRLQLRRSAVAVEKPADTPLLHAGRGDDPLTGREREVATLAARGVSSRGIATTLGLSVRTVDNHLGRVYAKLGASGRAELAAALGG